METGENAAIIGAPGVGKTMALDAYQLSLGMKVARLTITPVLARSMREIMSELCDKLDMNTWTGESIYEMDRALHRRYIDDWIVIVDEDQNISLDCLRQLLTFSVKDGGQLTFVYCGNEDILKQVNTDRGALAQISRRIVFRELVDSISDDDANAITNSFGVEGLDAYRTMCAVGQRFHADGIAQVLHMARRLADRETIKASHVRDALAVFPQYRSVLEAKPKRRRAD